MCNSVIPDDVKMQIYKDGLQPTVQSAGKALSIIPRAINVALAPLEKIIYEKECSLEKTKALIAEKIENHPIDSIVTPDAYVAYPALQAISCAMDSDILRNMYANLLSKAMVKESKDFVHPSFVESIKQMSPIDAKIFNEMLNAPFKSLVDLVSESNYDKFLDMFIEHETLETNISGFSVASHSLQSASFNLLSHLGFVTIELGGFSDDDAYSEVLSSNEYVLLKKAHSDRQNLSADRKSYSITDLGKLFAKVCVNDSVVVE